MSRWKSLIFMLSLLLCVPVCNAQLKQEDIFAKRKNNKPVTPIYYAPKFLPAYCISSCNSCPALKYSLPTGGFFCRIESAIHQRLNFWIKFRMGTDDKYSD
jgi:hypothetical protein